MEKTVILCSFLSLLNLAAYSEPASEAVSVNLSPSEIDTYKQKVMSNLESVALITGLAADPQIQALSDDPQIVAAARAGDLQALLKNEKFMDVVNNPKLQEEVKKIKQ